MNSKKQSGNFGQQGVRFVIVGLTSNALLFLLYLLATAWGLEHKTSMTLLFFAGFLQTFVFNKNWTFEYRSSHRECLDKYAFIYGAAYLLNLVALLIFADYLRWPHQWVQGVMIFVIAAMLFFFQKYWVFVPR